MQTLYVDDIDPGRKIETPIVHESGEILFSAGEELSIHKLGVLKKSGISKVYLMDSAQEVEKFRQSARYTSMPVPKLPVGKSLGLPLYGPDLELLLQSGTKIDEDFKNQLQQRDVTSVYLERADEKLKMEQVEEFRYLMDKIQSDEQLKEEMLKEVEGLDKRYKSEEFDRRRHERYRLDVEFTYYIEDPESGDIKKTPYRARLLDISQSGIGMVTSEDLQTGQKFYTDISLPNMGQLKGTLEVVRTSKESSHIYEVGARFVSVERS